MQINAKDYPTLSEELLNALAEILKVPRESVERKFIVPLLTNFCHSLKDGHKLFTEMAEMSGLPVPSEFNLLKELKQVEEDLNDADDIMQVITKGIVFVNVSLSVNTLSKRQ